MDKKLVWRLREVRLSEVRPGECFSFLARRTWEDSVEESPGLYLRRVHVRTAAPVPQEQGDPLVCLVSWELAVVGRGEERMEECAQTTEATRRIRWKLRKVRRSEVQPGECYTDRGPEYWERVESDDPMSIGLTAYIRTHNPLHFLCDEADAYVWAITWEVVGEEGGT